MSSQGNALDRATILPIDADSIDHYWPFVSSFIESALEHTDLEISLAGILSDIVNRQRQLWIVKSDGRYIAAVVTMVYTTDNGVTIGDITFAGGTDHDKWSHFPEAIEPFFREHNCRFVDITGRRGWVRKYQAFGFQEKYVVTRKDISDGQGLKKDNQHIEFAADDERA